MKPKEQIASPASTPKIGRVALLCALLRAKGTSAGGRVINPVRGSGAPLAARRGALASALCSALAVALVALPGTASAETCPNEQIRAEQGSERLPDCRAYELVTPMIKGDNSSIGAVDGTPYGFPDGNHVYYKSLLPMPGALTGSEENALSERTAAGWITVALAPPDGKGEPANPYIGGFGGASFETAFTSDFSEAFINSGFDFDPLDQDEGQPDAYRLNIPSQSWSLAALPESGPLTESNKAEADGTFIAGISENGSHVLFESRDQLSVAPGTPTGLHGANMLYDRTGGHTYAVGVLPDGSLSTCDIELGDGGNDALTQGTAFNYSAVSPDGTNVVFMTYEAKVACPDRGVYLRENDTTTVQLTGGYYMGRSSDGSKVFTAAMTAGEYANGLYEYDIATGDTTTISPEGWFIASSADGARVYYLISGGVNAGLYLWEDGTAKLIPNAGEGFASETKAAERPFSALTSMPWEYNVAVATPDGSKLLFLDTASLTGYNNYGPHCDPNFGGPAYCSEAYVYNAETGSTTCVSCNPTGAPPSGVVQGNSTKRGETSLMDGSTLDTLLPPFSEGEISPDGSRVFFETMDALVPQDTNGVSDVYEWENGRIYLISSGQGTFGSSFSGASSNGDDVFITSVDHLAPQDIENSTEIYDARVDGGFPYTPFSSGCNSGQCQGPQTPAPAFGAPASATFVGLGNPASVAAVPGAKPKLAKPAKCKQGFVKKQSKCVKKPKSKKAKAKKAGNQRRGKS